MSFPVRWFAVAVASLLMLSVVGCGFQGEPFRTVPVATTPAEKLEGNWLIFGTLPHYDIPLHGPNPTPGLALSLTSDGKSITGAAFLSGTCDSGEPFAIIFGNAITAVPDNAGHFVTSSSQVFGWGFTLTGTAPDVAGKPWAGTYQLSNTGLDNNTCAFASSGTFSATPVGQVSGKFTGSGMATNAGGNDASAATGFPVGITADLVQGITQTDQDGTQIYNSQLLQGTIQVSGIPCFTQGVPSKQFVGSLLGNAFYADFTMDDGSEATAAGTIDNVTTTHLLLTNFSVSEGMCAGNYVFQTPGATLSR